MENNFENISFLNLLKKKNSIDKEMEITDRCYHYELQLKNYNAQQKEIEKLKRFIEYFKPKPRFVARAKDREKKLEHMKMIDKPYESKSSLKISFML